MLVPSAIVLFCCSQPLAVVPLVFAIISRTKLAGGDVEGARKFAKFALIGIIASIVLSVLWGGMESLRR